MWYRGNGLIKRTACAIKRNECQCWASRLNSYLYLWRILLDWILAETLAACRWILAKTLAACRWILAETLAACCWILAETLAACRWILAETLAACGFLGPSIPPFHLQNQELRRSNAVILIYNHFCSVKTCLVSHYHKLTNCYHSFSPEISSNFNPTYSCLHSVQFRTSNVIPTHHRDRAFLLPEYKYRPALDSKRKSNERTTTFCLGMPALHTYIFIIQLQCIWILLPSLLSTL